MTIAGSNGDMILSAKKVLVIGGGGRIGRSVAADIAKYAGAQVTLTGRRLTPTFTLLDSQTYCSLSLDDEAAIEAVIAQHDLIVHCAGPFRSRNHHILTSCINQSKPYLDVADSPDYVNQALTYGEEAQAAGVTAIISTGVFPGISGSMVRQGIEQLDTAEKVHLSYLVAGSGGAGLTVMRTTFIELQTPFMSKVNGRWQAIAPYSQREVLTFPRYGKGGVYWFNTVEALTIADTFPELKTIVTKFGSVPDYYNRLTWLMARLPSGILKNKTVIEALSKISYQMTQVTDSRTGVGIAMRVEIEGKKDGEPLTYLSTLDHEDTAYCAGCGTGAIAQLILSGRLNKPGVWSVEQALSTPLFEETLAQRKIAIKQDF
ncbi:saccharopine dehydrogenase [Synechococcus sp. PCC 7335]|uniref:saccharopine dehydrogenase family protein n=1 Tax=Synechococcus sp. (strain ATCC 29403 / PCC 7335) TaxID=91464 RepID=UPI00017EB11D|nr:saccharopine dehydrogenase NADP-binding domain-containing protein [Synechococcus sp. PCC 7335]EDX87781.1 saccharopine dehydrogenase [Synechococcus sp. PCC 7335]